MNNIENLNIDHTNAEEVIKFRAECPVDAEAVRSLLWPWALSFETETEPLEHAGRLLRCSDIEVTVRLCPGSPSVDELRYICDALPNAHYAADTMEAAKDYTGERVPRTSWTGDVKRPTQAVLSAALGAVTTRQKVLEAELERMQKTYRELRAMHDLGLRWIPPVTEGNSPGWLAVAQMPETDLTRFIVVTPSSLAAFRSPQKQEREVNLRLKVINS